MAVHEAETAAKSIAEPGSPSMRKARLVKFVRVLAVSMAISMTLPGCDLLRQLNGQGAASPEDDEPEQVALYRPSAHEVARTQQRLIALGYDPGPVDGVLGRKTSIAIKHFQVDEEMDIDGELTPDVMERLQKRYTRQRALLAQGIGSDSLTSPARKGFDEAGPSYEVGDAYVYTDGRVETVLRVGPERTLWETAEGSVYTSYRNFILPPISWKSGAADGENQVQPAKGQKWPPATTKEIVFTVESRTGSSSVDAPRIWSGQWRCAARGVSPIKATIGRFDAITIECIRAKPEPGTWKKRTWYYVPKIGHYVRRTDLIYGTGQNVTVDLVAIRPGGKGWPPAARGGLDWAIQSALDAGDTKNTVEWRSSAVGATFNIRLMGDVPVSGTVDCLRYHMERTGPDLVRHFPAIACKRPGQERWLIPGLDANAISPRLLERR